MNLTQIKYFNQTVKSNSVSLAAQKLFVTQPAVTKQIKLIEEEIGSKLLYKKNNSLNLTAAGDILYEKSSEILSLMDELEDVLKNIETIHPEKIIVGCGSLAARFSLPFIIKKILQKFPKNDISIFECGSNELSGLVADETIDFGIGFQAKINRRHVEFEKLFASKFKVICSTKNPIAKLDIVKIDNLLAFPFISYNANSVITDLLRENLPKENLNEVLNAQNSESIIKYVQLNLGISIVPDYILRLLKPTDIAIKEFDIELSIDIGIFKGINRYLSPVHMESINLIKKYYRKNIENNG